MDKKEIVETAVLAFVFGCGFWMSAEMMGFVFEMASGLIDML